MPSAPQKTHSLFPDSPTNRLLREEAACGCLFFSSIPCLTPAQTYALPPVITLEISPSSALSTCIEYEGHIEYRRGLSNPKARLEENMSTTSGSGITEGVPCGILPHPCEDPEVYMCWSVNWDGPIPPYPGLPPGKRDDLHFPSTFILDGSHGKWDCRVPQCWDNSRPWAPLIPSKCCPRYANHPAMSSLVDVAIEAFSNDTTSHHVHPVNASPLLVLPSLLFTINLFDSIRDAEIALFKAARGRPFVMWLRSYMYPVPDGENDIKWLKERKFRRVEEVFGRFGVAQRYACELIALAEWCHSCWKLMIGQYPTGPLSARVRPRKDCVGGWVTGAPLPVIWHYQSIGVPLFFIEHCREERLPKGLMKELLPGLGGVSFTQSSEYLNPPAILEDLSKNILLLIAQPLQTTRARFQDARWAPYDPPEYWANSTPTPIPVGWFPSLIQTTSQFKGLSECIQQLVLYNNSHRLPSWYMWTQQLVTDRNESIQWKEKRQFITHPRHAFQQSVVLKPIPLPDTDDTVVHFWVERVDGEGFAEVNAAHIPEFKARGFVGWRHKLCKQLVFFYLPRSHDTATESRITEILKPLEYTEDSTPMDLNLDLDNIPCDPPTMESQMPGVRGMERLEQEGRILVSERMAEHIRIGDMAHSVSSQGDKPTKTEEGEVGGFDHQWPSKSGHTHIPLSSEVFGPVRTIKSSTMAMQNVGLLPRKQQRGKHKPWQERDAPSDRRQRLWAQWGKLANFFNSHQDLRNDLEPPPATAPGKHSNLKKPAWEGMQKTAEVLCMWIHRNRETAKWMVLQHSDDKDRLHLWKAALNRLDYNKVWNTPQMDMPREDEPAARREWLWAKEHWLPTNPS